MPEVFSWFRGAGRLTFLVHLAYVPLLCTGLSKRASLIMQGVHQGQATHLRVLVPEIRDPDVSEVNRA